MIRPPFGLARMAGVVAGLIGIAVADKISILTEFVLWQRAAPEGNSLIDRSLAISLWGSFSHLVVGKE